ncbi:MAG: protein kinase, partial [Planctomycetota bacterium]
MNQPSNLVGGYEPLEKIGSGGMGVVYRARQVSLDRVVALKVLPRKLSANPDYVHRFQREARLAAQLDHPNVVRVIEAGRHE